MEFKAINKTEYTHKHTHTIHTLKRQFDWLWAMGLKTTDSSVVFVVAFTIAIAFKYNDELICRMKTVNKNCKCALSINQRNALSTFKTMQ